MGFDKIISRHAPVNRIESISARSEPPLCINAQVGKRRNERLDQLNRFRSETTGGSNSKCRETFPNCSCKWNKTIGIHAKTFSHALIEQYAVDYAFVVTKTFDDSLWIIADFLQCVLADLKNNLDLLARSVNSVCDLARIRPDHVELNGMDADATIGNRRCEAFPEIGIVIVVRVMQAVVHFVRGKNAGDSLF